MATSPKSNANNTAWALYRTIAVAGNTFSADADWAASVDDVVIDSIPTFELPGSADSRKVNALVFAAVCTDANDNPIAPAGTFTYHLLSLIDYKDASGNQRSVVVTAGTAATSQAPGVSFTLSPRAIGPGARFAIRMTAGASLPASATKLKIFVRGA